MAYLDGEHWGYRSATEALAESGFAKLPWLRRRRLERTHHRPDQRVIESGDTRVTETSDIRETEGAF